MIGPFVPKDDDVWSLFINLKHVIGITTAKIVHADTHKILRVLVSEYLSSLCSMFKDPLKPKHHFLIHYW